MISITLVSAFFYVRRSSAPEEPPSETPSVLRQQATVFYSTNNNLGAELAPNALEAPSNYMRFTDAASAAASGQNL